MEQNNTKQKLQLTDRRELAVDNVENVDALGEDYVDITSDAGRMIVEGEELIIEELNREKRTLRIKGKINSITYMNEKKTRSIFSKRAR